MNANKPKGLGRGLGAILDIDLPNNMVGVINSSPYVTELSLDKIKPNMNQPRTIFDDGLIEELSQSITSLGVIQPITVKDEENGTYTIISGERRYRASRLAGLDKIPVYIRKVDDNKVFEMALVENIQREDLNAMEVADGLNRLIDECGITQESLSSRIGKNRSTISNYIRLLKLPPEIQLALKNNLITMGHARALLSVESVSKQISMLKKIIKDALSVRQVEVMVKEYNKPKEVKKILDEEYPESYVRLVEHLEHFFNQEISIKRGNNGDGKIVIGFRNDSEIDAILKKFEKI